MEDLCDLVTLSSTNYVKVLSDGIWSLYKKKEWADLLLKTNGNDIMVHTFMLAIFAPKLIQFCDESKCEMPHVNMDKRILHSLLEFIYRGEVKVFKDDLTEVKRGAEQFGLQHLIEIIDEHHLTRNPNSSDVIDDNVVIDEIMELEQFQTYDVEVEVSNCDNALTDTNEVVELVRDEDESWKTTMSCPKCNYQSKSVAECIKHLSESHQIKIYRCDHCEFVNVQKKEVDKHMSISHPEKSYHKCEHCNYISKSRKLLQIHRKSHSKTVIECGICDKKFHNQSILQSHIIMYHSVPLNVAPGRRKPTVKPVKCDMCEFVAKNKTKLEEHVNFKHYGEKNFMCETCGARLGTRETLRTHSLLHQTSSTATCPVCAKTYTQSRYLVRHMRLVHLCSVKLHQCHMCSFVSKVKANLKKHIERIHGQEWKKHKNDGEEEQDVENEPAEVESVSVEDDVCVLNEEVENYDVVNEIELAVEYLHADI